MVARAHAAGLTVTSWTFRADDKEMQFPIGARGDVALPLRPRHRRAVHQQPGPVPRRSVDHPGAISGRVHAIRRTRRHSRSALDELRARGRYGRLDAQQARSISTTPAAACTPTRRCATRGAAERAGVRQSALGEPQLDGDDPPRSSADARRCSTTSTPPADIHRRVHAQRHRRAEAGRRVLSVRSRAAGCLLTFDNHNSVNGIREFARAQRRRRRLRAADRAGSAHRSPAARRAARRRRIRRAPTCSPSRRSPIFPACKHPLDLIDAAHGSGWDVLLDAAAFVPTNRLDLSRGRSPISSPSRSTRCSATRPASAVC